MKKKLLLKTYLFKIVLCIQKIYVTNVVIKKMCGGIEKIGCDVIVKSEMEKLIKTEQKLIKSNAKERDF